MSGAKYRESTICNAMLCFNSRHLCVNLFAHIKIVVLNCVGELSDWKLKGHAILNIKIISNSERKRVLCGSTQIQNYRVLNL